MLRMTVALTGLLLTTQALAQDVTAETTYEEGGNQTFLKVVEPEGARCRVTDRGQSVDQTVPFAMPAPAHMYLDVSCTLPGGAVWQKKIEARANKLAVIKLKAGAGGQNQAGSAAAAPAAPAVPEGPKAMEAGAFAALKAAVAEASFSDDKINVIQAAVGANHFTIAQVGGIVDALDHSSDKVRAVEIMRGKIIDPGNAFQLGSHFDFSSDKEKVLGMFK